VASFKPALRFVMARMSHGGNADDDLRTDHKAERNRDAMRSLFPTTPRGFYHLLGLSDPQLQAQRFQSIVGDLQPGEFVMLDVEPDPVAKVGVVAVDKILATLEAIEKSFGHTPWIYIGIPYPGKTDSRLSRFPLIFPAYCPESEFPALAAKMERPVGVWQWGGGDNGANVPGIGGRVDSNKIIDEAIFQSNLAPGLTNTSQPVTLLSTGNGTSSGFLRFMPEIGEGAQGNAVILLQALLVQQGQFRDLDVNRDGKFGGGTARGIAAFQASRGLPQSGRVDAATWNAIGNGTPPGCLQFMPEIARGATGNPVILLQTLLIQRGLFRDVDGNRDGAFGDGTERGVNQFQASRGLPQTGRVDAQTWNAFGTA
jgi:peptidoglycan hydrolase-like protein with peptidoglycan-binding domain